MVDDGFISEVDLVRALQKQLQIPYMDVSEVSISEKTASIIPETLARTNTILPIENKDGILKIAVSDPLNYNAIHDIEVNTGLIRTSLSVKKSKIQNKIHKVYTCSGFIDAAKTLAKTTTAAESKKTPMRRRLRRSADYPVINNMIEMAAILRQAISTLTRRRIRWWCASVSTDIKHIPDHRQRAFPFGSSE